MEYLRHHFVGRTPYEGMCEKFDAYERVKQRILRFFLLFVCLLANRHSFFRMLNCTMHLIHA